MTILAIGITQVLAWVLVWVMVDLADSDMVADGIHFGTIVLDGLAIMVDSAAVLDMTLFGVAHLEALVDGAAALVDGAEVSVDGAEVLVVMADLVTEDGTHTMLACGILMEITTKMGASTEADMVLVSQ